MKLGRVCGQEVGQLGSKGSVCVSMKVESAGVHVKEGVCGEGWESVWEWH